ncbi:Coiled-coil domain-containing protein 87 [Kappamyces sp. JEL0829]|nr:Coiled-coil domain-containing protein 87 [Kappamyces sp. JEL0829]
MSSTTMGARTKRTEPRSSSHSTPSKPPHSATPPALSGKKRLLDSLFPKWEMSLYPAGLAKAISKVERHDFIKNELHRLELGASKESEADAKTIKSQRQSKNLMRMGLDRLPISALEEIKDNFLTDKKLPALNLLDEINTEQEALPSIRDTLLDVVKELEETSWLSTYESTHITNTFIINFSRTFDNIHKLMVPSLTVYENRILALKILGQVKHTLSLIMSQLLKMKTKMQNAGFFSAESNSDRLISTFRTMLSKKLNNSDIIESAMGQLQIAKRKRPTSAKPVNILAELSQELDRVTHPVPKLAFDTTLLQKLNQKTIVREHSESEEAGKLLNMQYTPRGLMLVVDPVQKARVQQMDEDLIRLIKNTEDNEQSDGVGTIWGEEKIVDSFHTTARKILEYEADDQHTHFKHSEMHSSEDPILRAHAHMSNKARSKRVHSKLAFTVPNRYFRHKNIKVYFDFQKLLQDDDSEKEPDPRQDPKPAEGEMAICATEDKVDAATDSAQVVRTFLSQASSVIPKTEIVIDDNPFEGAVGDSGKQEVRITSIDFLDENLSRFKEVEELYSEIMKAIDDSNVDKDEAVEYVLSCPAAPIDQPIEGLDSYMPRLALRKPLEKQHNEAAMLQQQMRDADGIPVAGSSFQIVLSPTKSNIPVESFRRNRRRAMKKVLSSKYHFRYNYGGYIPARSYRKGEANFISSDDYDDFLATSFCDFIPMLLYQSKRKAEKDKELEEEKKELQMQLEETQLVEKITMAEEERISELFQPSAENWKPGVLDYIEDNKDPNPGSYVYPENRVGLKKLGAAELQKELESIWTQLQMPPSQKIEMAIKYGDHRISKSNEALEHWKVAAKLISERESLLLKLEEFETKASDPSRFFERGSMASSKTRMKEAKDRENMLRPLRMLETEISRVSANIRNNFHEVVTLRGLVYVDKMKHDYQDIVLKCSKKKAKPAL